MVRLPSVNPASGKCNTLPRRSRHALSTQRPPFFLPRRRHGEVFAGLRHLRGPGGQDHAAGACRGRVVVCAPRRLLRLGADHAQQRRPHAAARGGYRPGGPGAPVQHMVEPALGSSHKVGACCQGGRSRARSPPSCAPLPVSTLEQVRRELQRDTNSSHWMVNGQQARMRDVEELVRDKFKVQLDNLCQVGGTVSAPLGRGSWLEPRWQQHRAVAGWGACCSPALQRLPPMPR
jgi:hypothetical protein